MRLRFIAVAALVSLGLAGMRLAAHHAFTAEFDANKPIKLQGAITKVEWINPHAWIHVEVKTPEGKTEAWMIEAGTPNSLLRRGLTKDTVKTGTIVMVEGYQAKDGSKKANGRNLTLPDGRTLFMGTETGASDRR